MIRPKATHAGTLFDGLLDCYVLEDERRVVSQRGVVRALTHGGRDSGNLTPYLQRLPSEFRHLATGAEIDIFRPDGGVAKAREAQWVVDLLRAYDQADDDGALHASQRHLARNARKILRALAGVGLVALIDEATCYQEQRAAAALSFAFRAILLESRTTWDLMWPPDFVESILRLHGEKYIGGPQPQWLASTYDKLYSLILGADVVTELRRRNPEPQHGKNHHQWLSPEAREVLKRQIPIVVTLADMARSKDHFWEMVEHKYLKRPLQLSFSDGGAV